RLRGGDHGRLDRHDRTRLPARSAAPGAELARCFDGRAGALLDADLSADGDRAGGAADGPVPGDGQMTEQMTVWLTPRNLVVAVLLIFLALVPVYVAATGNAFLMTLFTRIIILAIAATSLNLILGYGGMVSFGHAVYLGVGGYAVGILAYEGVASGFAQWPVAIAASALLALLVGALS